MRFWNVVGVQAFLLALLALPAWAHLIQPNEADSQDAFTYEFLPTMNFETLGPGFQAVLGAGKTSTGHDTHALVKFDLATVALTAAEVTKATLGLYVRDGGSVGFPFANASDATPVEAVVSPLNAPWSEMLVTWAAEPGAGSPAASTVVDGIDRWVLFDVTALVKHWLDGTTPNEGFLISQAAEVLLGGQRVSMVFDSSSGLNRPYLEIVPEPASMGLWGLGVATLARRRRRRCFFRST